MKGQERHLRKGQTEIEARLWHYIRDRRLKGKKFRRQHPIGAYILDFYCPEAKLAIELDGGGHAEQAQKVYAAERERVLALRGIEVLRFWDNEVWKE